MPKSINPCKVYKNPFHVLKSNTPTPLRCHRRAKEEHVQNRHNLIKFKL